MSLFINFITKLTNAPNGPQSKTTR